MTENTSPLDRKITLMDLAEKVFPDDVEKINYIYTAVPENNGQTRYDIASSSEEGLHCVLSELAVEAQERGIALE